LWLDKSRANPLRNFKRFSGHFQAAALERRSPARKDIFIRRLESSMGRDGLVQVLDASDDQRARALMAMLLDPAYGKYTLAKLCERAGLRCADLIDVIRRAKLNEGLLAMIVRLPRVMEDVAVDSLSRVENCVVCSGGGQVEGRLCHKCSGEGTVRICGDAAARRLLFEIMGLLR
jgi:hypothetical protein